MQPSPRSVVESVAQDLKNCAELMNELRCIQRLAIKETQSRILIKTNCEDPGKTSLEAKVLDLLEQLREERAAKEALVTEKNELQALLKKTYGQVIDDYLMTRATLYQKDMDLQKALKDSFQIQSTTAPLPNAIRSDNQLVSPESRTQNRKDSSIRPHEEVKSSAPYSQSSTVPNTLNWLYGAHAHGEVAHESPPSNWPPSAGSPVVLSPFELPDLNIPDLKLPDMTQPCPEISPRQLWIDSTLISRRVDQGEGVVERQGWKGGNVDQEEIKKKDIHECCSTQQAQAAAEISGWENPRRLVSLPSRLSKSAFMDRLTSESHITPSEAAPPPAAVNSSLPKITSYLKNFLHSNSTVTATAQSSLSDRSDKEGKVCNLEHSVESRSVRHQKQLHRVGVGSILTGYYNINNTTHQLGQQSAASDLHTSIMRDKQAVRRDQHIHGDLESSSGTSAFFPHMAPISSSCSSSPTSSALLHFEPNQDSPYSKGGHFSGSSSSDNSPYQFPGRLQSWAAAVNKGVDYSSHEPNGRTSHTDSMGMSQRRTIDDIRAREQSSYVMPKASFTGVTGADEIESRRRPQQHTTGSRHLQVTGHPISRPWSRTAPASLSVGLEKAENPENYISENDDAVAHDDQGEESETHQEKKQGNLETSEALLQAIKGHLEDLQVKFSSGNVHDSSDQLPAGVHIAAGSKGSGRDGIHLKAANYIDPGPMSQPLGDLDVSSTSDLVWPKDSKANQATIPNDVAIAPAAGVKHFAPGSSKATAYVPSAFVVIGGQSWS